MTTPLFHCYYVSLNNKPPLDLLVLQTRQLIMICFFYFCSSYELVMKCNLVKQCDIPGLEKLTKTLKPFYFLFFFLSFFLSFFLFFLILALLTNMWHEWQCPVVDLDPY